MRLKTPKLYVGMEAKVIDVSKAEQIIYRRYYAVTQHNETIRFGTFEDAAEHMRKNVSKVSPMTLTIEDKEDF